MFVGALEVLLGGRQLRLDAGALGDRRGELLLCELLAALANCAYALQAEAECDLGHPPFIGRPISFFSRGRRPSRGAARLEREPERGDRRSLGSAGSPPGNWPAESVRLDLLGVRDVLLRAAHVEGQGGR